MHGARCDESLTAVGARQQALRRLQDVMDAQAKLRQRTLQARLADLSDLWNLNTAEADMESRDTSSLQVSKTLTPEQLRGKTGHSSSTTWPQPWSRRRERLSNVRLNSRRQH